MVEQWATWVGAPTIFAPRVCLKARPLLRIRYGSVSDFAQPMSNVRRDPISPSRGVDLIFQCTAMQSAFVRGSNAISQRNRSPLAARPSLVTILGEH